MKDFETFEHVADVGIRGFGKTLAQAFENGAAAMFSVMFKLHDACEEAAIAVECEADDHEALFVEWLNALLSKRDMEGLVFSRFEVHVADNRLVGKAFGEEYNPDKHEFLTEVKAATYSQLRIYRERANDEEIHVVQCIVDV
jgi:SHS2 domain-containing protein